MGDGNRRSLLAAAAALTLLAFSCTGSSELRPIPSPQPPEPTPAPRPIELPADEGAHENTLEWWYYSGRLSATNGDEFGFLFVIFQRRDLDGQPSYLAQLAITDVGAKEHVQFARIATGEQQAPPDMALGLDIAGWSLEIDERGHRISAVADAGNSLSLNFAPDPSDVPALHNETGWLNTAVGWTYYYSWPDLAVSGSLTVDGRVYDVEGTGWFDHQWGDFIVIGSPSGWQWMALQLGDGETLMITEARDTDGTAQAVYGTHRDNQDVNRSLSADADGIEISVLDTWESPHTGADYPSRWRLQVASLGLDVEIKPVLADQEITVGLAQVAAYWEGQVEVTGSYRGRQIAQTGYVELTGYTDPEPIEWRAKTGEQGQ